MWDHNFVGRMETLMSSAFRTRPKRIEFPDDEREVFFTNIIVVKGTGTAGLGDCTTRPIEYEPKSYQDGNHQYRKPIAHYLL